MKPVGTDQINNKIIKHAGEEILKRIKTLL